MRKERENERERGEGGEDMSRTPFASLVVGVSISILSGLVSTGRLQGVVND